MSLKILIDMNLSPEWVGILTQQGWITVHWSRIGDPRAPDRELADWALQHHYAVFSHDLDFSRLLAFGQNAGPSIIQVRGEEILPDTSAALVIEAIRRFETLLISGGIVVIDRKRSRARALPLQSPE